MYVTTTRSTKVERSIVKNCCSARANPRSKRADPAPAVACSSEFRPEEKPRRRRGLNYILCKNRTSEPQLVTAV